MAGSQATIALAATWPAIHVAASSRVPADAPSAAADSDADSEPRAETAEEAVTACPVTARTVHAPSPPATTRATAAGATKACRRRAPFPPKTGWRSSHSRNVVAMTPGHDGSGRRERADSPPPRYSIPPPNPATRQDAGV